eukprot:6059944-Pyramimonas_sp.AAC.1
MEGRRRGKRNRMMRLSPTQRWPGSCETTAQLSKKALPPQERASRHGPRRWRSLGKRTPSLEFQCQLEQSVAQRRGCPSGPLIIPRS